MPEGPPSLRGIDWTETFPFTRIFRSFVMAIAPVRLMLALAAVVGCYLVGRLFDAIWLGGSRDGGAIAAFSDHASISELEAHATMSSTAFRAWREATQRANREFEIAVVRQFAGAASDDDAAARLQRESAARLIEQAREDTPQTIRDLIDARAKAARDFIRSDDAGVRAGPTRETRLDALERAADCLRFVVGGRDPRALFSDSERAAALGVLLDSDPHLTGAERTELQARLTRTLARESALIELRRRRPVGPFIALVRFESRCAAAAAAAVAGGRVGLGGTAFGAEPTLLGSVGSGVRGLQWIGVERPLFALLVGVSVAAVLSYFCCALARMAAIHATRDEHISLSSAVHFAREKFLYLLLAPGLPIAMLLVGALLLIAGGLLGAVPVLGETLSAALFVLALLVGTLMALAAVATLLGFNLMWPIIAVEHSDGLDAVSRGFNYVATRCSHVVFYNVVFIAYGGAVMLMVRLIAMIALKFAHAGVGLGMSVLGLVGSDRTAGLGPLDAMWHMPAWSELTLLPGALPFWGQFGHAPLSGSETFASWLIAAWVFLHVGLVFAVGLNLWLCGSTQIYLLLRRRVDATDYGEVFIDDDSDLPTAEPETAEPETRPPGTSLPVVSPTPQP